VGESSLPLGPYTVTMDLWAKCRPVLILCYPLNTDRANGAELRSCSIMQ